MCSRECYASAYQYKNIVFLDCYAFLSSCLLPTKFGYDYGEAKLKLMLLFCISICIRKKIAVLSG